MADEEGSELSPADKKRFSKAARQLASYINFMRWTANFRRNEVLPHPRHRQILLLSPMQSSRFCFAMEGETIMLGVQDFECAWAAQMPIECAYISDRLYLVVKGVPVISGRMSDMAIGIYVDDEKKRQRMREANFVQLVRVDVEDGRVAQVGRAIGLGFELRRGDIVNQLEEVRLAEQKTTDVSRFL